ncbi:hypothetical protein CR105_25510 [Massilia eurypsychrophila]|uniref:Uncharacterized protein n=1 Tax=Massilia eurypsychrophila TaxID=1485217 RepID=A0A2G8T8B7_9BURK|nr:hypothetical protein [Massilia eurypsychrophila]PIL42229.1 hypothetical protein CR105_25510 [Massilia eurypsychrophila]
MATDEQTLRELIRHALFEDPDKCACVSVRLLESLAKSLRHLIGAQGTELLLLRAARRVVITYPWFQFGPQIALLDSEFAAMRDCLERQSPEQAGQASALLFDTLIGVLESLIGVHLTTVIFSSAISGARAPERSKEQHDE